MTFQCKLSDLGGSDQASECGGGASDLDSRHRARAWRRGGGQRRASRLDQEAAARGPHVGNGQSCVMSGARPLGQGVRSKVVSRRSLVNAKGGGSRAGAMTGERGRWMRSDGLDVRGGWDVMREGLGMGMAVLDGRGVVDWGRLGEERGCGGGLGFFFLRSHLSV